MSQVVGFPLFIFCFWPSLVVWRTIWKNNRLIKRLPEWSFSSFVGGQLSDWSKHSGERWCHDNWQLDQPLENVMRRNILLTDYLIDEDIAPPTIILELDRTLKELLNYYLHSVYWKEMCVSVSNGFEWELLKIQVQHLKKWNEKRTRQRTTVRNSDLA